MKINEFECVVVDVETTGMSPVDGDRIITCHGPRSVYDSVISEVRKRWQDEISPD